MPDVPFNDADDEALPRSDRLQILSPEEYELLWGFPRFTQLEERAMLEAQAQQAACISSRPVYILRELVDLLRREPVALPGYTFLQDVVRGALAFERKRLAGALEGLIDEDDAKALERLLADDEGLHAITTIKRQPRDFSYQQLLGEIARGQQLRALFALSQPPPYRRWLTE